MSSPKRASAARVSLGLSRLTVPQKLALARTVAQSLTGNGSFLQPPVPPAALSQAADFLDKAEGAAKSARQTALLRTAERDDAERALESVLAQLEAYVQMQSKGVAQVIASAGMPVRGAPVRTTTPPPAPADFIAETGAKGGEAKLRWTRPAGARSYVMERAANPNDPTSWTHVGATTKTRFIAPAQPSGRMWYRVAAVGAQGQGPWSDPATCIVP